MALSSEYVRVKRPVKAPMHPDPNAALRDLAARLRDEDTPISPHIVDPTDAPVFGLLAAQGPNAAGAPGEYAFVVEAVREGYLLHYGQSRLLRGHDEDLALLAGDYLYALGLERLAALGDIKAVAELAELIARSAQLHAEGHEDEAPELWRTAALAIGGASHGDRQEGPASLDPPSRPESIDSTLPEASC
jgi:hypothetical protein